MPPEPSSLDMFMARHSRRKVEQIVQKTYDAFVKASEEYGTLSADELVALGVNLFMNVTVMPMEKLTDKPVRMRCELAKQVALMIRKGDVEAD